MNNALTKLVPLVALALVDVTQAQAQEFACRLDDTLCWQNETEAMCRAEAATSASCAAWLNRLGAASTAAHPTVRSAAASASLALSDRAVDPEAKAEFRQQAQQILRDWARDDPSSTDALVGLSIHAETAEEKASLLRQAVAIDPTNAFLLEMLANVLARFDMGESAEVLERAYSLPLSEARKLHFAGLAVRTYEAVGAIDRATALREKVRGDYKLDERAAALATPAAANPERMSTGIEEICSEDALRIFGAKPCLDGIEALADATRASRTLDDSVSRGMLIAAQSSPLLDAVDPAWRSRFEDTLERLVSSGTSSNRAYAAYALLVEQPEKRQAVMRSATERFPNDGELVFGLGLASFDVGNKAEAIRALSRARALLPESRHAFIDQMLEQAAELPD